MDACQDFSEEMSRTHSFRSIKAFVQLVEFVSVFLQQIKPRIHLAGLTKASVQLWNKCIGYPKQSAM